MAEQFSPALESKARRNLRGALRMINVLEAQIPNGLRIKGDKKFARAAVHDEPLPKEPVQDSQRRSAKGGTAFPGLRIKGEKKFAGRTQND